MLMSKDEIDTEIRLPAKAQRIYDILREAGEKMTRNDLAELLGKNALNHADLAYLEVMEANGMVSITKEDARSPFGFQWTYQAIDPDSK